MRSGVLAVLFAAIVLAGCGGSDDGVSAGPPAGVAGAGAGGAAHIHGLGIDPADRSLLIATHTGLFRAPDGQSTARRVGASTQDTMGFTVVGPGAYLGSGHPDPSDTSRPPLLGLVESSDAGRSWQDVSLLGEADFHVLRTAGERVYGVNASDGRLHVSGDGGRTWEQRVPPGRVIDLVAHPGDPDRLIVSSDRGLFSSADGGRRWRPLSRARAGLLAWPAPGALHLVDASGTLHSSDDAGATWREAGRVGGAPAAFMADDEALYVALAGNEVLWSSDAGRSWTVRVAA